MPYVLSPVISESMPGMWFEGTAYSKENLYSMDNPKHPPVNYDAHILKPHSLTHMEAPAHTQKDGITVDSYYSGNKLNHFYGEVTVLKFKGKKWQAVEGMEGIYHWEVSLEELKEELSNIQGNDNVPQKLILTVDDMPVISNGTHDPNYVLTMSQEVADYLVSGENFNMYGTSWKSTDFKPGAKDRPIHNTIFQKAVIFECLDLNNVPEGQYIFMGFPLPLAGASESPVCPVLFEKSELSF
ncbi:MAG: hypothetical protein N4A33_02905 [Bacteriovoracaceae bacterium]|jgi:kynurenine formamidase|nr:hypothetical protein [Bacteriovoracaceae bacterium]